MTSCDRDQYDAVITEDGGVLVLARVIDWDGVLLTQAATSAVNLSVYEVNSTETSPTLDTSITVSSVILDTPVTTHPSWKSSLGYNFKHTVPASAFSTGDKVYRIEYKITPVSGEVFWITKTVYARRVAKS